MSKTPRKRSALVQPKSELPMTKIPKKSRLQQQANSTNAWEAVNSQYPAEINSFYPSLASVPDSLTIVKYLASLPAVKGALDFHDQRIGARPFTLELGSKGSIKSGEKYGHFHARNRSSRAQGNLKAVLAQASGSPATAPCRRCAESQSLWKTCMKAATMPGLKKDDTLNGACPGCYYNGAGHCCSHRYTDAKNGVAQSSLSSATDDHHSFHTNQLYHQSLDGSASPSHQQNAPKPDHAQVRPGSDLDEDCATRDFDSDKIMSLLAENTILRLQVDRLQARVDDLEELIEAEEQQCTI